MDFPGYYYSDTKFVPHHESFIVGVSWHITPNSHNTDVQTTFYDKTFETTHFHDLYKFHG